MSAETDRVIATQKSVGLYISEAIHEAATIHAKDNGQSFSRYVVGLIEDDLEASGKLPQPTDPRQELLPLMDEAVAQVGRDKVREILAGLAREEVAS